MARDIEADGSYVYVASSPTSCQPKVAGQRKPPPPTAPKPYRQAGAPTGSAAPVSPDSKGLVPPNGDDAKSADDTEVETDTDSSESDDDDFEDVEAVQFMESIHHVLAEQDKELKKQQEQQQQHTKVAAEAIAVETSDASAGHRIPHSDQFATAEGDAGAGADADIVAKDEQTTEAAAARAQLVQELGNDRFCGALYILIESRNHTNTKTVNHRAYPTTNARIWGASI